MLRGQKQTGFTIVELLIVVVVIAILAAITVVSYNGIQQRATNSTLQSELSQVVKKLEVSKVAGGISMYPGDLASAGINANSNGTLSYFYSASSNTYCAQIVKGSASYAASSNAKNIVTGNCSDSGLLAWWKLNGNATDSSTNSNDGTANNTTSTTGENGVADNALAFTSGAVSEVIMPNSSSLNDTAQTFTFWVRPTNWSSAVASVFMAKRSSNNTGFFIAYLNGSSSLAFDCGGSSQRWITGFSPPLNEWSHITLTCPPDGNLALYVNGIAAGTRAGVNSSAVNDPGVSLRLGRDSQSGAAYILNGALDDVRVYGRTLTAAEALQLYNGRSQ